MEILRLDSGGEAMRLQSHSVDHLLTEITHEMGLRDVAHAVTMDSDSHRSIFIDSGKLSESIDAIGSVLAAWPEVRLRNRRKKAISIEQLRERQAASSFFLSMEGSGNTEVAEATIAIDYGSITGHDAADRAGSVQVRGEVIASLRRMCWRRGLNPVFRTDAEGKASLQFDPVEVAAFIGILNEAKGEIDFIVRNSDLKNISLETLRKRSKPSRFLLSILPPGSAPRQERFEISILTARKFALPAKNPALIRIADPGPATGLMNVLLEACRGLGIQAIEGGSIARHPRINFRSELLPSVKALIFSIAAERSDIVFLDLRGNLLPREKIEKHEHTDSFDIGVISVIEGNAAYIAGIEVAVWHQLNRFNRQVVACNRPSARAARVPAFNDLVAYPSVDQVNTTHADPLTHNFPIDVVYTWVDDQDDEWRNQKQRHEAVAGMVTAGVADTQGRFRNRDELRFSLRSIEMYAPFVRNIYIVTSGQTPSWINRNNPRIRIVDHAEIFRDQGALPTFNSHAIEAQLHRIEGLAEHFLYFNDDMMLGNLCTPADFFEANGIARIRPEPLYVVPEFIQEDDAEYLHAGKNVVALFRRDFGVSPTNTMRHIPYAVRRSLMEEMEARYPTEFQRTSSNRFRSKNEISPISFFYCHYAYFKGMAIDGGGSHRYIPLWSRSLEKTLKEVLASRKYRFICLNDSGVLPENQSSADALVDSFLNKYFPIKSSFES
ncbi:stealth family protein [Roseomonas sp. 18066]|uniref:stealth family protein n=1 Tax=Roseomonas sp. 18066 TaxID=2681412 RepID=UPI0013573F98|nr:stealth family protein [Roseomonas sp. 18066]